MVFKRFSAGVLVGFVAVAARPAMANDLELVCEDAVSTSGPYLCATALDFGG